jgi:hypothetical protein
MDQDGMNTELDQFKAKWKQYDQKLDAVVRLNRRLLNEMSLRPVRSTMRWLRVPLIIEAVFTLATVVLLGAFIADNVGAVRFALPAAVLDVFAIALLNNLVRQIVITGQIDYGQPIAAIQKRLEALRLLRIRYTQGIFLIALLAWPLLCIVGFKALFDLDAYAVFGTAWIWSNVLVGLAVVPLAIWASKTFGDRLSGSPFMRYVVRTISGSGLNAATDALARLSTFDAEPDSAEPPELTKAPS